MKEFELGKESEFTAFPAEVTVNGEAYFLAKNGDEFKLLSRSCPHAGGFVHCHENMLYCPLHMWTFHKETGECLNVAGCELDSVPVANRDGQLVAVIGA